MTKKIYFITGTDTDVGKTLVSAGLLALAKKQGLRTAAIKPVAAGCFETDGGLRNDDALLLQEQCSVELDYDQINPVALHSAIAPHIAAEQEGRRLNVSRLTGFCRGVLLQPSDFVVIEGAGGWRVPVNSRETLADLPKALDVPVILVVAMRLGCINHALLTAEAIRRDGLTLAGWVANTPELEPMKSYAENLLTLKTLIGAPLLGEIPYLEQVSAFEAAQYLALEVLTA